MGQLGNAAGDVIHRINANVILRNVILAVCAVIVFVFIMSMLLNVFTRHNKYEQVPDFSGMSFEQAEKAARKGSFDLAVNDSVYVIGYPGGVILDQIPVAGTEVKSGRRIFVTLNSFGRKSVRIPYVKGYSLRQAVSNLQLAGLEVEKIIYRQDIATNEVLGQQYKGASVEPHSRIEAPQGSGVTLIVGLNSDDPLPVMPKLVGLSLGEAKNRIWESGMNVGKLSFDEDISLVERNDARVYSQIPSPAIHADPGTSVDLRFTLDDKKVAGGIEQSRIDAAAATAARQAASEMESEEASATE